MTFDELQALADKDLKINDTELDLESLKTPQLHNKYMKFHNQYTNLLKKAEQDLARLTREKWEYYTGKEQRKNFWKWQKKNTNVIFWRQREKK